jgi:hypothetical protein
MGNVRGALSGQGERLGYSCSSIPLVYGRSLDYNAAGNQRAGIQVIWELAMRSMITVELITRKLLLPIIETRMTTMMAEAKYQQEVVTLPKHSTLDEAQLFEYHDVYQIFEIQPDGKISIADLIIELENFDDKISLKTLMDFVGRYDDGQGRMSFENFLELMELLEKPENANHPLKETFNNLRETNRHIRLMSIAQQALAGYL